MVQRVRTRSAKVEFPNIVSKVSTNSNTYPVFTVNRQTTSDEEHPWRIWNDMKKQRNLRPNIKHILQTQDVGGDFTSTRTWVDLTAPVVRFRDYLLSGQYLYQYDGPVVIPTPAPSATTFDYAVDPRPWSPQPIWTGDAALDVFGTEAFHRTVPTSPHASIVTSLGELRADGLPAVPGKGILKSPDDFNVSNVGGEYLNYQFGIAPTISDIKTIVETVRSADKLIKQYLRDSGRVVRRRYAAPVQVESTGPTVWSSSLYPPRTETRYWTTRGPVMRSTTTKTRKWFSAAYLYYVNERSVAGVGEFLDKANHLYGTTPSLSDWYNLQPWTWLLDWFSNTGDVIDNVSLYLQDPYLMRWGYVMEHMHHSVTYTQELVDFTGKRVHLEATFHMERKVRRDANPFGFGLTGTDLNSRQKSILAALGMTKFRNPGHL